MIEWWQGKADTIVRVTIAAYITPKAKPEPEFYRFYFPPAQDAPWVVNESWDKQIALRGCGANGAKTYT